MHGTFGDSHSGGCRLKAKPRQDGCSGRGTRRPRNGSGRRGLGWRGGLSWGAGQGGGVGTEGQRRERVPSARGELSPPAHRGQGPATHPGTPGTAVTARVTTAGAGRGEMLGTAGSSSAGAAPPPACGTRGLPFGARGAASPCSCCALAAARNVPAGLPAPLAAFSISPPLRWGGRAGACGVSTGGTPQRTVQSSGCTFGVGVRGGSRRCLRVTSTGDRSVTPPLLEPPGSGPPQSQRARGCPSPGSCVSTLRKPWHNGGTAKPRPGGASSNAARARAVLGPGAGLWLRPGTRCHRPCSGRHAAQERVALWKASRTWKPHETESRRRIAFQTQTTREERAPKGGGYQRRGE